MSDPRYIALFRSGELTARTQLLQKRLHKCDICPRACKVNRIDGDTGFCRSGSQASVASYCDHHGEEPAISGTRGSGTIFFSNCNLRCTYCQNYQISQGSHLDNRSQDSHSLAEIMLHLQNDLHCHNINLVSPTQWVPQIMGALNLAVPQGLRIPLIYNTNGYDSHTTLRLLDGIIDIYLPDIKYSSDRIAADYSQCSNYVKHCRNAIKEMYRQTGNLKTDKAGLATRGLIVRHLILPDNAAGSEESLQWLSDELSREITLSVMAQYHPCFHAMLFPALNRIISPAEYESVVTLLERLGFENGWLQEMDSAEHYLPDFNRREHPFSPG